MEQKNEFTSKHPHRKITVGIIYLVFLGLSIGSIYIAMIHNETIFFGDDFGFHLSRIEGLAQSIGNGVYLPRINYFITGGMGYPTGIFYPEIFLYPGALLRVAGFSLIHSYLGYLVLLNFLTFISAYHCFYRIKQKKEATFIFSVLYTLSSYRLLSDVIYRGALGESIAFLMLPIAFYGLYCVTLGQYRKWPVLALGMAGLFLSHTISTVIFGMFIVCWLLANYKQLLQEKKRILSIVCAAGVTILLVSFVLFPMIEQLLFQRLRVQDISLFYLQREALTIPEYFTVSWKNLGYNNLGLLIPFLGLLELFFWKKLTRVNRQLLVIGWMFFFMSTSYFPHGLFHGTFFNTIQFPWRYFMLVTFCFSWAAADSLKSIIPENKMIYWLVTGLLLCGVLATNITGQVQLTNRTNRRLEHEYIAKITGESEMGYGKEFLPSGTESWLDPRGLLSEPSENVSITNMNRQKNVFSLDFDVPSETTLIFPILYYKGYEVTGIGDFAGPERSETYQGEALEGFLQVKVNGKGSVKVQYVGTFIQKLSLFVSGTTFLCLTGWFVYKKITLRWINEK